MHSETVLVNALEYKGDTLVEAAGILYILQLPSLFLMFTQQTSLDSYSQAIFFFSPVGAVTSVYPFVAMASALTLLPL